MGIEQQRRCRGCCCNQCEGGPEERVAQRCGDIAKPQHASRREGSCGQAGKKRAYTRGGSGACRAEPKRREARGGPGGKDGVAG